MKAIVNADDLGLSVAVNDAVLDALDRGLCTGASLLANGPATEDALRRVAGRPVGVHLNLSEFAPITRAVDPLLVDGRFGHRSLHVTPKDAPGVLAEWSAQVARVLDSGVVVDHLDSHQHLHHRPVLTGVFVEVARRFGIRRVRGMGPLRPALQGPTAPLRRSLQAARALRFRRRLRVEGLITPDGFASVSAFLAAARRGSIPRWETVELMAHPGNPHDDVYADELTALASGALGRLAFPITPVRWADL